MTMPRPVKRPPDQADFLSAPKIAKELGVNPRTVTNWAGALRHLRAVSVKTGVACRGQSFTYTV